MQSARWRIKSNQRCANTISANNQLISSAKINFSSLMEITFGAAKWTDCSIKMLFINFWALPFNYLCWCVMAMKQRRVCVYSALFSFANKWTLAINFVTPQQWWRRMFYPPAGFGLHVRCLMRYNSAAESTQCICVLMIQLHHPGVCAQATIIFFITKVALFFF